MAIEIVDFSIKNGDFPLQNVSSPEGISPTLLTLWVILYIYWGLKHHLFINGDSTMIDKGVKHQTYGDLIDR